jgi:hypothetical protein
MSPQPNDPDSERGDAEDIASATSRGISQRLSDPHLTDHDRWVLRQFGRFLSGIAPEPDPRAPRICAREHAHGARVHDPHERAARAAPTR